MKTIKLMILMLLAFVSVRAQDPYSPDNKFGTQFNRGNFLWDLGIPRDTFSVPIAKQRYPHIAAKWDSGPKLYLWDTLARKWSLYEGGSGGGSTTNFDEVVEEFTGSTSSTVTVSNAPMSDKARQVFLNGCLIKETNVSQSTSAFTLSGFTREAGDVIAVKYSYTTGGSGADFDEVTETFTGGTSNVFTVSNTPLSSKAQMIWINGCLFKEANVSIVGDTFTVSGITIESTDYITIKYSH